jgi:hypothetical protein
MDRVVELVRQKIDAKMGEFSSDLMEALEIEENRRKALEEKVAFLEEKLVNSLMSRLVPFGHVFGPLLSSFSHQVHALLKVTLQENTKTSHKAIVPWY